MWFRTDIILQNIVKMICNEGRKDELIKICDFYNFGFHTVESATEWGINYGEFIGKYHFGEEIYEFRFPGEKGAVYFIGTRDSIKKKIYEIL